MHMNESKQINYILAVVTLIVMTVSLLWSYGYVISNVNVSFMIIAYGWACLMVFTTVKYFSYKKNRTISQ